VEQVVLALDLQALLRQDLLHLDTLLLKHFPVALLHLVTALDLHLQALRVVCLKVVSLSMIWVITCCLQALFSAPLPHFLMAIFLATLLTLLTEMFFLTKTTVVVLVVTVVVTLLLEM